MNKKISVGTFVALSMVAIPSIVAHADEGVATEDFAVKDQNGNIVKEYKENERVPIAGETDTNYRISLNQKVYEVEKSHILKTIKHEELSLVVNQDNITLKASPDLFGKILHSLSKGEVVHRIPEAGEKNGFIKVRTSQSVEGWVLASSLKQNLKSIPVTTKAFIDDDSQVSQSLKYGDSVSVVGFENHQYKVLVNQKPILVDKSSISFVEPPKRILLTPTVTQPIKNESVVNNQTVANANSQTTNKNGSNDVVSHNDSLADRVIDKAFQYLGVPYVWGGTTPNGFDCSGFTQYVLASQGVYIPRVASEQAKVGQTIDRGNLQKGDLIFFETYKKGPSHVGIYIGNGNFIHAGGDRVQVSNLSNTYYSQRYLWAKRMF